MGKIGSTQFSFKRYEKKYILTPSQLDAFMAVADEHLVPDEYFKSTVCSIYYDCEDFRLIIKSLERPIYKEKIRIRSYGVPDRNGLSFVELKKKFKGVVYKRRIGLPLSQAEAWLSGEAPRPDDSQIAKEIDYFLSQNNVSPKVFIGADRTSYMDKDEPELRITIDSSIRWRNSDLSLSSGDFGENLLENGCVLMEIKIPQSAPIWLAHILSNEKIFPTRYSKYGTCYKTGKIGR